jgi:predicted N-acetyltransferase YhbS
VSVDPAFQRQGIGSMLLQFVCSEADQSSRDAFVLSSPAGVQLYAKFGFKAVGLVETHQGNFTSMLRRAVMPVTVSNGQIKAG